MHTLVHNLFWAWEPNFRLGDISDLMVNLSRKEEYLVSRESYRLIFILSSSFIETSVSSLSWSYIDRSNICSWDRSPEDVKLSTVSL